jgi:Immunity protein 26
MSDGVTYHEGDWFVVPLAREGHCLGLVARTSSRKDGVVLGYFFGPWVEKRPDLGQTIGLSPAKAILVARFGHLGLVSGTWALLGRNADWNRERWPMPTFGRRTSLGATYQVDYSDTDALQSTRTTRVDASEIDGLPHDGVAGVEFIQKRLERLARMRS